METIPEALTTNTLGVISIGDLAQLIEAPAERLRPLVEHRYLRVVAPYEEFERTIVARPGRTATEWLKNMFQPIKMRPFIPVKDVGKLWGITERNVVIGCRPRGIPVQSDPVFGELMSFSALKRFARAQRKYSTSYRYDRAGFLRYYLSEIEGVGWKSPLRYSQKLECEIHRITSLSEPWRTIRATELIIAFRDAETVTQCLRKYRQASEEWAC